MVQIFLCHCSKDTWLIDPIAKILESIEVKPYRAKLVDPTPYPLPEKINNAINDSDAVFVFLTKNCSTIQSTRDVINWEISAAHAYKKPIYVFKEKGVEIPIMLNYLSCYSEFDPVNQESLDTLVKKVQEKAFALKDQNDGGKAALAIVGTLLGTFFLALLLDDSDKK
jgi:hypothetical protein